MFVLGFYEIDLAYGGPEEGGWYFSTGQLVRALKCVPSEKEAYRLARRANDLLRHIQRHRREVSSAAYDGGRYAVEVYKDRLPDYWPKQRPHYE